MAFPIVYRVILCAYFGLWLNSKSIFLRISQTAHFEVIPSTHWTTSESKNWKKSQHAIKLRIWAWNCQTEQLSSKNLRKVWTGVCSKSSDFSKHSWKSSLWWVIVALLESCLQSELYLGRKALRFFKWLQLYTDWTRVQYRKFTQAKMRWQGKYVLTDKNMTGLNFKLFFQLHKDQWDIYQRFLKMSFDFVREIQFVLSNDPVISIISFGLKFG